MDTFAEAETEIQKFIAEKKPYVEKAEDADLLKAWWKYRNATNRIMFAMIDAEVKLRDMFDETAGFARPRMDKE
jgi:DNA primase